MVRFKVFSHKEKHFKFLPPLNGEVELESGWTPVPKAVVSSLHALFQQDLQQVIKSKYSFKRGLLRILCSSQCWVWKGRFRWFILFYKESWHYKQGHKALVRILKRRCSRPRLWKLTFVFFSTSVLNSKCFSIYKDALQIHFWQSKKGKKKSTTTNVGRNLIVLEEDELSSLLPLVNLREIRAHYSAGFVVAKLWGHSHTRAHMTPYLSVSCILNSTTMSSLIWGTFKYLFSAVP